MRAKRFARWHGIITVLLFSVYFMAGFFLHPLFLVSDIREKIRVFGDTITVLARVLDPPQKPVVTGSGVCVHGGPAVQLDWADDVNSTSYDITRDSLPLTTGVVVSAYTDTAVTLGQTYAYVVTARGPMGPGLNEADAVSVTTPTECPAEIIPSITIQTFSGKNIEGDTTRHGTMNRQPRFTGTTNILNARIDILAVSDRESIAATVFANAAGYFEWQYGGTFDTGTYDVTFTATDVSVSTVSATQQVAIDIQSETSGSATHTSLKKTNVVLSEIPVQTHSFIDLVLQISGAEFHAGDRVSVTLRVQSLSADLRGKSAQITWSIVDAYGQVVESVTEEGVIQSGTEMQHVFSVPPSMVGREYRVIGEVNALGYRAAREELFRVVELPLLQLGGTTVTYEGMVRNIGWLSLSMLFLFLWWMLAFAREYYLYAQSRRNIWGKDLHSAGYF